MKCWNDLNKHNTVMSVWMRTMWRQFRTSKKSCWKCEHTNSKLKMRKAKQEKNVVIQLLLHTCEPSGGSILRVPSVPPVNFQNLPPMKKIKYNKILTYILRSIFLEIPHLELLCWRKTPRDTNGKGKCHI